MKTISNTHPAPALLALVLVWVAGILISGTAPYDRATWLMEVAPCLIVLPVLWLTRARLQLSSLLYVLITLHGIILMVGGAYTYARVPLGFWAQEWFHWSRNNYDKLGHFAQGFVPALLARELLLRIGKLSSRRLVAALCVAIALAISAIYELIEWGSAIALGSGADDFLGTQGDPWDTQSDMLMALIGSMCAMLLARWHDRSMAALPNGIAK